VTAQIARQDEVDNAIHDLLCVLVGQDLAWNIEDIGHVRQAVFDVVHRRTGMSEMEFYPYVDDETATRQSWRDLIWEHVYYLIEITDYGVYIYGPYDSEERRDVDGVQAVQDWTNDVLALTVDAQGEIEIFPVEEPANLDQE